MKLTKLTLALAAAALIISFTACSNSDSSNPLADNTNQASILSNSVLYSPDLTVDDDPIENPTSLTILSCIDGTEDREGYRNGEAKMGPRGAFFPMGRIFRYLDLDTAQIRQVIGFMKIKNDCTKALLVALRESEKAIMEDAKAKRDVIIAGMLDGSITEEDGIAQLRELRAATKAALEANPLREETIVKLKDCEDIFLASVKSILTEEQASKWDELTAALEKWRESRRKGHR